jgi:phospholipase C
MNDSSLREGSIGLGYRVPMIIASPWSRGGYVNSEVFDHTSSLQFLENFLEKKFNKKIKEENITEWRRTICGDLTSVFRPFNGENITKPEFLNRKPFIEGIHQAQFKGTPDNYKQLTESEIKQINTNHNESAYFPKQEKGVRSACALPYENYVHTVFDKTKNSVELAFKAGNKVFGNKAAGSPFRVYAMNSYQNDPMRSWDYSVAAGDMLKDEYNLSDFVNENYHLRVYGPNGFYREFLGDKNNPLVKITCSYEASRLNSSRLTGNLIVTVTNNDSKAHVLSLLDNSYKTQSQNKAIAAGTQVSMVLNLAKNYNWYDFSINLKGYDAFEERFAGHVETGQITKTDPLMGGIV